MINDTSYDTGPALNSKEGERSSSLPSSLLRSSVVQELRDEIDELKIELLHLNEEVLKNRQRIMNLEKKKKAYGDDVKKRVESMLTLIEDYGGLLKSSSIKIYMGLSKDELYRALKCAKEQDLIEVQPDPQDRRGYIINIKTTISGAYQNYHKFESR